MVEFKPEAREYYSEPARLFIPFEETARKSLNQFTKKDLQITKEIWSAMAMTKGLLDDRKQKIDAAEGRFAEEKVKHALARLRNLKEGMTLPETLKQIIDQDRLRLARERSWVLSGISC